jgi:enediyne biosynthesis protein E4
MCVHSFRRTAARSVIYSASALLLLSQFPLRAQETDPRLLRLLATRARQQADSIQDAKAFHQFQFTDRIKESGITFDHQIVDDAGKNWKPAHYDHGNGVAVADVDGDGRSDIYFVSQLGSNQLWRNVGGGRFEDITSKAGVALAGQIGVTASFADIDNDGDPDLFVTTVRHGNRLFENLGGGEFKDITKEAAVDYSGHSSAAVFFDFDRDGLLDLFVCNVGVYTQDTKGRGGFYLAVTNGFFGHLRPERTEYSLLYRNLGRRKFREVSKQVNLRDAGWSGDASPCDFNGDGFPDLYVLNMQGDNHYYENQAGKRFVEKTSTYFPKTPWGAMGIKFFDHNNDGLMDLYLTDMHSDMTKGQGVEALNLPLSSEKAKSEKWCMAQWTEAFLQGASNNIFGNAFYLNRGGGKFDEASDRLGLETYWPWGPSTGDLNADGFQDLFVTAGMGHPFRYGINSLLLNDAGQNFLDAEFVLGVEPRAGGRCEKYYFTLHCDGEDRDNPLCREKKGEVPFQAALSSRSSVVFDLDGDGDLDLVTNEFNDRPQVLVSNLSEKRTIHWLKIMLAGTTSNRDGLGALVKVYAGGQTFTQCHDGKSGYLSQSSLPLYFGLGEATKVDRIEVTWPGGRQQTVTQNLGPNQQVVIKEGTE